MYKVGKYVYKSKEHYQKLLLKVSLIFAFSIFALMSLKYNMPFWLYNGTSWLSIIMIIHLALRYAKSKELIKNYIFNEY